MKKKGIIVLVFGLILFSCDVFASEIEVESRISEVAIYPDSALLSRVASLKLSPGEYKVIFSNIIPEVDENSLRVSAQGTTEVRLFGAQVKKEFLEEVPSERIKQLKEEIQKLEDDIRRGQDLNKLLLEEKNFLDSIRLFSNGQIPKDLVTKMPTGQDLDNTLKFLDTKLKENYMQVLECELKNRDLGNKVGALKKQLSEISSGAGRKLKRLIAVELEVLKAANFNLSVSYLVGGANWEPIYDARANFEKSEVEMLSYGIIRQRTGEDWQDVEISLSTAKPAIGGRMPYVAPWFLRPYQPPRIMEHRKAGFSMSLQKEAFDKPEEESIDTIQGGERFAAVQEKGIAVVYKLPRKASIKSDGSEHKLPVSSQTLQAKFEYSTYPRVVLNAYLGSRVTNAPNLQLLAGRVNIFLEGDFVGSSSIDNIGPGEEFDLYLGVDENVKVKREQIEKKIDETLIAGIPSPTRRTTLKYKLTLENYKHKKINLKLFEAMPVSEDDRIKVKIEKVSLEPKEKDWKDRKGIWLWELELEPKQKKEIIYTFIIEHPREMPVEGL